MLKSNAPRRLASSSDAVQALDLPGAEPLGLGVVRELAIPIAVSSPQLRVFAGLLEPLPSVFTQGVEQPEPDHTLCFGSEQDRLVNERGHQIEESPRPPCRSRNLFCRWQFKASGKD